MSWTTWSDGAGGAPTITGDPDWGKLELIAGSGDEARSGVVDMGDAVQRIYTLTENQYGAGQSMDQATLQIRGDANPFSQDDALPAWEDYTVPVTRSWRYIQVREVA